MTKILGVRDITKAFGMLKALDNVSLDIGERSLTILIGPNGSGKTTLINVISGYYKPDSGEVQYQGSRITGWPPYKIYRLGLSRTFQVPSLFPKLTVLEHLLVAEKNNPGESFLKSLFKRSWVNAERSSIEKASRILGMVGLSKLWDSPASNISGGQMKLLEIGRALMSDAKMLLLDEPVSGVNPTLAHEIFSKLVKLRDELGVTFLIIEHRLDIALEYIDYVQAMAYGKMIASGVPEQVMNDAKVIEAYLGA